MRFIGIGRINYLIILKNNMTVEQIIKKFELFVDDGTELSAAEELDLLNDKYLEICSERPWEFLKKSFSGSINGTSITLPSDFQYILETEVNGVIGKFVFVGEKYYQLVCFQDRKNYENVGGYYWINIADKKLEFSESVSGTLTYNYLSIPNKLEAGESPIFPDRFHRAISYLMATDDYAIQQFDKAKSYAKENEEKAEKLLDQMRYWDANLFT